MTCARGIRQGYPTLRNYRPTDGNLRGVGSGAIARGVGSGAIARGVGSGAIARGVGSGAIARGVSSGKTGRDADDSRLRLASRAAVLLAAPAWRPRLPAVSG